MKLKPEDAKEVGRLLESMGVVSAKKGTAIAEAVLTWYYRKRTRKHPNTILVQVGGIADTFAGWQRRLGLSVGTAAGRIKRGWSIEKACSTPRISWNRPVGKYVSIQAAAKALGTDHSTIASRLKRGWPEERATTQPVKSTSRYRGVCWRKDKKRWYATAPRVNCNSTKGLHLGVFHSEILAAHAYDRAAYALLGDRAKLNFPLKKRKKS